MPPTCKDFTECYARSSRWIEPPGLLGRYEISDLPLNAVTPASSNVSVVIRGGLLASSGLLEYAPKVARVEVDRGHLDDVVAVVGSIAIPRICCNNTTFPAANAAIVKYHVFPGTHYDNYEKNRSDAG